MYKVHHDSGPQDCSRSHTVGHPRNPMLWGTVPGTSILHAGRCSTTNGSGFPRYLPMRNSKALRVSPSTAQMLFRVHHPCLISNHPAKS